MTSLSLNFLSASGTQQFKKEKRLKRTFSEHLPRCTASNSSWKVHWGVHWNCFATGAVLLTLINPDFMVQKVIAQLFDVKWQSDRRISRWKALCVLFAISIAHRPESFLPVRYVVKREELKGRSHFHLPVFDKIKCRNQSPTDSKLPYSMKIITPICVRTAKLALSHQLCDFMDEARDKKP